MSLDLIPFLARGAPTGAVIVQPGPLAVGDTRNIAANETTVSVNVLANDLRVGGAEVTIQGLVTGATAQVVGQSINVTRSGTAAGNYSLTYRATTPFGVSEAMLSGTVAALIVTPTAVNDIRNLSSVEITAVVDVLANDTNAMGGMVTIPGSVTGAATAVVEPDNRIKLTRIGIAAGSYSLIYRVTNAAGFSQATLSGSITAYAETGISTSGGTTETPGAPLVTFAAGTTTTPGSTIPARAGTS